MSRQFLLKQPNLKKEVVAYRMVRLAMDLQNEKSVFLAENETCPEQMTRSQ